MDGRETSMRVDTVDASGAIASARVLYAVGPNFLTFATALSVPLALAADSRPGEQLAGIAVFLLGAPALARLLYNRGRPDAFCVAIFVLFALVLGVGFSGSVIVPFALPASGGRPNTTDVIGATIGIVLATGLGLWLLCQAWIASRLLSDRLPLLDVRLVDIVRTVARRTDLRRDRRLRFEFPQHAIRTAIYYLFAGVFGALTSLLVIGAAIGGPRAVVLFAVVFGAIALGLFNRGRRHAALRADKVLEIDHRQPVLFLRSFVDDGMTVKDKNGGRSLEAVLAPQLRRIGPFVGIANPQDKLPLLGAAKQFYSNDSWQSAIERWIEISRIVVLVAGRTEWVKWELDRILAAEAQNKLVILIPPDRRGHDGERKRWLRFYFAGTPFADGVEAIDTDRIAAICFRDGHLLAVDRGVGKKRAIDFIVAITIALYVILSVKTGGRS